MLGLEDFGRPEGGRPVAGGAEMVSELKWTFRAGMELGYALGYTVAASDRLWPLCGYVSTER